MRLFDYKPTPHIRHEFVNGHYELDAVQEAEIDGHTIAYRMGTALLDNSCCGFYGCAYAMVLGERLPQQTPGDASTLRLREISDTEPLAQIIRRELCARQQITVVNFYMIPHPAEQAS